MPYSSYHISSIDIKNFRQYRNAHIEFSRDPDKMFTIIRGVNGAGKTNIMNAITWCLYGTEKHLGSNEMDLPVTNTHALMEKPHGLVTMSVSIKLADAHGDKYIIERKLTLYNNGQIGITRYDNKTLVVIPSKSTPDIHKNFKVYDQDKGGWKTTEYFDKSVKSLLPEDLATYFLFDGEKLEDFFEHTDNTKIGIEDVSQIKIADQAMATLNKLEVLLRRKAKGIDPQIDIHLSQLDKQDELVKKIGDKIRQITLERDNARIHVDKIEWSIMKSGGDVSADQKNARNLKAEINRNNILYNEALSEKTDYVLKHLFVTQLFNNIASTVESVKAKSRDGTLPPKIQETFINELLENGKCICGNNISEDQHPRKMVKGLLSKAKYSRISEICTDLKYELNSMLKPKDILERLNILDNKNIKLKTCIQELQRQHKELEVKISGVDNERISGLADKKSKLSTQISKLNENLGAEKERLRVANNELSRLRTRYERATANDLKYKHIRMQQEFCERAYKSLEAVRDKLLDHVRDTVQTHTRDYFLQLLWKKDTYNDVTIDENYNITARHIDGYNVRAGLSKGGKARTCPLIHGCLEEGHGIWILTTD